jgi:hypothetical protein
MVMLAGAGQFFSLRAAAEDGKAPARLAPDIQARPISVGTSSPATAARVNARWASEQKHRIGATALRWREPAVENPATKSNVRPVSTATDIERSQPTRDVAPAVLAWGQDDPQSKRSSVRLVTQLGPLDPFDDPFGDRRPAVEPRRNNRSTTPTGIQPVPEPEQEAPLPFDAPSVIPDPAGDDFQLIPPADPDAMLLPEPQVDPDLPPFGDDTAPAPPGELSPEEPYAQPAPLRPIEPTAPCDRTYNRRNCCAEGEQCQHFRTRVGKNTLATVSLNISPSFKPDALNAADEEQARALRLAQSEIRSWRNRQGEVVARGQLTDLQFGRAYIEGDGEVAKIPVRDLSDDDWCFLAAWWGVPTECSLGDDTYQQREWLASTMTWKASALCHKPLYFEEVQLERYGHSAGPFLQPAISGAHFFLNIAALPYKMGINPPNECRYALGYYRPGSCAPWLLPPLPLSVRGGLMEAGAILGGIYVIP